jgi:hypothetical protein
MNKFFLGLGLVSIIACVGCGSGASAGFGSSNIGNFSNASVSGQYVYQISGTDVSGNAFFREAGAFTADGKGNITAGEDDLSESSSFSTANTTGTYSISSDGTGSITINFGNGGGAIQFAVTVVSNSRIYLAVSQVASGAFVNGTGLAELQTASALSAAPSGTFAFGMHTVGTTQGSSSSAGVFTVTGGAVSGSEDVNRGGALSSLTITGGLFNAPDANGRGTGNFTDSLGVTTTFSYYIVNSTSLRFFATNGGVSGLGQAQAQSGTFSTSSFTGGYAFHSIGDDAFSVGGVHTIGRFTAGGNGTITDGALDSVVDGNPSSNVAFSGTYTAAANGRIAVTLNPSGGGSIQQVYWVASPSQAFFLTNDTTKVEDGVAAQQSATTFSNSTMNAQYGLVMSGFNPQTFFDRVGTLRWDGSGKLVLNEFVNNSGSGSIPGLLNGTYSVSGNGRATGSINTASNNFVFYLISASDGYALQEDSGTEVSGQFSQQQ